jgi:FeS assembly SUF system protein
MKSLRNLFREKPAEGAKDMTGQSNEPREAWSPERPALAIGTAPTPQADTAGETPPFLQGELLPLAGHPLEAAVIHALKQVYDPEIPVDVYELGLIYGVKLTPENDILVSMTLTSPGCPVAGQMPGMVEFAIQSNVPEARNVDVEITWDPPWRQDMMSDAAKLALGFI